MAREEALERRREVLVRVRELAQPVQPEREKVQHREARSEAILVRGLRDERRESRLGERRKRLDCVRGLVEEGRGRGERGRTLVAFADGEPVL